MNEHFHFNKINHFNKNEWNWPNKPNKKMELEYLKYMFEIVIKWDKKN